MKSISQVVLKADSSNKNGNIYPKKVLEQAISDFKSKNGLLGQLGMFGCDKVSLKDASHFTTDLRLEDNCLVADIEILETPAGKRLGDMVKNNEVVFRIAGTTTSIEKTENATYIINDIKLTAINAVWSGEAS